MRSEARAARSLIVVSASFLMSVTIACGGSAGPIVGEDSPEMAELWQEPVDLEKRDLALGPGGSALVPDPDSEFRFEKEDTTGHTRGYEVEDAHGRKWDVKIGDESRPEMVASR